MEPLPAAEITSCQVNALFSGASANAVISLAEPRRTQFDRWMQELETRHLANLRFPEVTRALRAVSAGYVQRRAMLSAKSPFDGAGKRAAYAMFYGPLHFLTVTAIVEQLGTTRSIRHVADWGCGTGAAGAAWAAAADLSPRVTAIDLHPWALGEAAATYRAFGIDALVKRGDITRLRPPVVDALVAGWVVNELHDTMRDAMLPRLLDLGARGVRVLIVEPIAISILPWWPAWSTAFQRAGGRADEWRLPGELPELVRRLDKASGLRHAELTARSLWLARD